MPSFGDVADQLRHVAEHLPVAQLGEAADRAEEAAAIMAEVARHIEVKLAVRMRDEGRRHEVVVVDSRDLRRSVRAMTFTAIWPTYDGDPEGGERLVVATPGDVDALVAELTSTTAEAAMVTHDARRAAPITESFFGPAGTPTPDHLLTAGVSNGYGYLAYVDPAHEMSAALGNPSSPAYVSDFAEYPAGSGVSIQVFTAALKEFLLTAQRPSCVEWQDA